MQVIAPVAQADLLRPIQTMLWKLEVYDGTNWIDVSAIRGKDYLKSVSISLGGAGMDPDPIAGTWSALLDNKDGIFHPHHPTSAYRTLLRMGREVRISVGGEYGGTDYYWQRLIGFMDAPRFVHGSHEVEIGGMDYTKLLADTRLYPEMAETESGSGSFESLSGCDIYGNIHGPTHWGRLLVCDAKASYTPTGAELYTLGDILDPENEWEPPPPPPEVPPGEVDPLGNGPGFHANWERDGAARFVGYGVGAAFPWDYYYARYSHVSGSAAGWVRHSTIYNLVAGTRYKFRIRYRRNNAFGLFDIELAQTIGGERRILKSWRVTVGTSWVIDEMDIPEVEDTGNLEFKIIGTNVPTDGDYLEVDWLSLYACDPRWHRYQLPSDCNGPYWVELNDEPIYFGDPVLRDGTGGGWFYEEATRQFYFDEAKSVEAGFQNLHIYYYTTQVVERVLADLLVHAGMYASRAAALADMDYTPTET